MFGNEQFRLHRTAKPEQATLFFTEWEKYLQHVEQTGRENQSIEIGLLDPPEQKHLFAVTAQDSTSQYYNTAKDKQQSRRNSDKGTLYFGKEISNDITLSEEQLGKLEQLREEATKAAASNSMDGNGFGDGGKSS